ncbi:MAG: hypothetical protein HWE22_03300 [Flavobacteriales bacterium]|nr:hypothetical protein [Flavobacteriales bacterium]
MTKNKIISSIISGFPHLNTSSPFLKWVSFPDWETGIEKNPTTLNITLTPFVPFNDLNADWTVTTCTKERMTLELRGASDVDVLIITRVG